MDEINKFQISCYNSELASSMSLILDAVDELSNSTDPGPTTHSLLPGRQGK